jgi:hypothetical protein
LVTLVQGDRECKIWVKLSLEDTAYYLKYIIKKDYPESDPWNVEVMGLLLKDSDKLGSYSPSKQIIGIRVIVGNLPMPAYKKVVNVQDGQITHDPYPLTEDALRSFDDFHDNVVTRPDSMVRHVIYATYLRDNY